MKREHVYYNTDGTIFGKKTIIKTDNGDKQCCWYRFEFGKYIKGLNGESPPLYNLINLQKKDFDDLRVFIVEGEKDVDTLESLGYLATTCPNGGSQKKWPEEYSKVLTNRDIVIITDNDEVGKQYGEFIRKNAEPFAKSVVVIPSKDIYPEISEKGDISDIYEIIGEKRTKEMIEEKIKETQNMTNKNPIYSAFGFYKLDELTEAEKEKPQFFVEGMIPVGLTVLSGQQKIGKSTLSLQMAAAISNGDDFLGRKTLKSNVIYFDFEGSPSRTNDRANKMGLSDQMQNVFISHNSEYKFGESGEKNLLDAIKKLKTADSNNRVIIIDTYSRARGRVATHGANAYDVDVALLEPIQKYAQSEKIAIILIHHFKKGSNSTSDDIEKSSGTVGITGSADSIISCVVDGNREDRKLTMSITTRDAEPSEIHIHQLSTMMWRCADQEHNSAENDVATWIISHKPKKGRNVFYPYTTLTADIFNGTCKTLSNQVREQIEDCLDKLYFRHGIGVQCGAISNGVYGIRIFALKD